MPTKLGRPFTIRAQHAVNLRLTDEDIARWDRIAKATGLSRTDVIRAALKRWAARV